MRKKEVGLYSTKNILQQLNTFYLANTNFSVVTSSNLNVYDKLLVNLMMTQNAPQNTNCSFQLWKINHLPGAISLAKVFTAASASRPVGMMYCTGRMKPKNPRSRSSMVYVYLMPAAPLAQSSDPPVGSKMQRNVNN
jgi:hypothetical protein